MREVISDVLWIGNARDARDIQAVVDAGIRVVIDLAMEEPSISFPREIVYCRFPLIDGGGNDPAIVRSAIDSTACFAGAKLPTLVACGGGMSRSPAIVAAALAVFHFRDLNSALLHVASSGPHDLSQALWSDVRSLFDKVEPKSPARLNLIVLRSLEPNDMIEFYRQLGIVFVEEQHGKGPVHWAAELDGLVFEIYRAECAQEVNSWTRLGFQVTDLATLLDAMRSSETVIVSDARQSPWEIRAIVRDPDGRSVELVQPR